MIKFTLKCDQTHAFESWFGSSAALDRLMAAGMVECPVCGSKQITKSLMAPAVQPGRPKAAPPKPQLSQPTGDVERAVQKLRSEVEKNSEYVGLNFASQARAMHDGDMAHKPIYGEAKPEEAKALIKDGVPVAPLPFVPRRNTN